MYDVPLSLTRTPLAFRTEVIDIDDHSRQRSPTRRRSPGPRACRLCFSPHVQGPDPSAAAISERDPPSRPNRAALSSRVTRHRRDVIDHAQQLAHRSVGVERLSESFLDLFVFAPWEAPVTMGSRRVRIGPGPIGMASMSR